MVPPVIMLTAIGRSHEMVAVLESGATDYIDKPVTAVARVRRAW